MNGTHLAGLEGTNPLGFLAALGVQVVLAQESEQPRLWWSDDVTPHAVVNCDFTVDQIADRALDVFRKWSGTPALAPDIPKVDESNLTESIREKYRKHKIEELKLLPSDIRAYLMQASRAHFGGDLSASLLAEGSLADWTDKGKAVKYRNGEAAKVAKPSDLYFTAGNQKFLETARRILKGVSREDVLAGLKGQWEYASPLPSLMWDVTDDRVYALRAYDPGPEKKLTNPGPEALAVLGLSLHPVFAGRGRTLTQGCSETWKAGCYCWPLWRKPATPYAVKSLLAHASHHDPTATDRRHWFRSWGVATVLRSPIHRSGQGGYGTFGPPEVAWEAPPNAGA